MLIAVVLLCCCIGSNSASFLACSPSNFFCPGTSMVSCECQAAAGLRWTVTSLTGNDPELLSVTYGSGDTVGSASSSSRNGYTVVLCDVDNNMLTSTLDFIFTVNVSVECLENSGMTQSSNIQTAGNVAM